ncbi:MAG: ABC transporter ATP-binding protein [Erysipelothrix sp.]|nr:ABC transporter ATP-binding protein [Erysipelothrix sp.]
MLKTVDLYKSFSGHGETISVLNGISISIEPGEFVMIMGESGSGKTTFLNCISTLDKPTQGDVFLDGKDITKLNQNEIQSVRFNQIGYIFQDNHMIETLTMVENIMIVALQHDKDAKGRALQLMEELKITHIQDKYPHQISGGEKQRCAIARALINNPNVLLADEPTASLHTSSANAIMESLVELNKKGQTIIMATHSINIAAYGGRLLALNNGQFEVDSSLKDLDRQASIDQVANLIKDIL